MIKIRGKEYRICGTPDNKDAERLKTPHHNNLKKTKWWRKFDAKDERGKLAMLQERTHREYMGKNFYYLKRRVKKHKITGPCGVCGEKAYCQHHIIPIINGGLNILINRINICHNCHCKIHGWMIPVTPEEIKQLNIAFRNTVIERRIK